MSKIVIIEGIDRVGKTTLSRDFFDEGFIKFHDKVDLVSGEARTINYEKINSTIFALEAFKFSNAKVLFDRFYLSEYVYGFINRKYNSYIETKAFDDRLTSLKATKILVIPKDKEKLAQCSEEHGSDLSEHNQMFIDYCKASNWIIVDNEASANLFKMLKKYKMI